MKRARVAILAHTHPSISKGGAEIAAHSLFLGMRALGTNAIFIAACPQSQRQQVLLGDGEHAVFYEHGSYEPFYNLSTPDVSHALQAILKKHSIDIANFHHFLNFGVNAFRDIAESTSVEIILTLHEFLLLCNHHGQMVTRPDRRLCQQPLPINCFSCFPEYSISQFERRKQFLHKILAGIHGFISPSLFLAQRVAEWGLPAEKIDVIENGIRHSINCDTPPCSTDKEHVWTFGFFGQITPFKGVDVILKAAEILADLPALSKRIHIRIHGNMVGLGDDFSERFNKAIEHFPFLSYLGPYQNDTVIKLMEDCDYVLMPSTWWENSPVVIQEAYLARRPVVCTGIGGMAEKVKEGVTGLHFRVNSAVDLVRTLETAADDKIFTSMQKNLPKVGDHLTMARHYLEAFERFRDNDRNMKEVKGAADLPVPSLSRSETIVSDNRPR